MGRPELPRWHRANVLSTTWKNPELNCNPGKSDTNLHEYIHCGSNFMQNPFKRKYLKGHNTHKKGCGSGSIFKGKKHIGSGSGLIIRNQSKVYKKIFTKVIIKHYQYININLFIAKKFYQVGSVPGLFLQGWIRIRVNSTRISKPDTKSNCAFNDYYCLILKRFKFLVKQDDFSCTNKRL